MTYAIIEFIQTVRVSREVLVSKGAEATLWLRRQAAPSEIYEQQIPGTVLEQDLTRLVFASFVPSLTLLGSSHCCGDGNPT
jgi:hypothetical protein